MKKYWKLITITIVIILAIGTYYTQSSLSASKLPKFSLKKSAGSDQEIKDIALTGFYNVGNLSEDFWLTADEMTYSREKTFFDQLNSDFYPSEKITNLQKEYRNFMRGKDEDPNLFYNDENVLLYANVDYDFLNGYQPTKMRLHVAYLDKKTDKKVAYDLPIPDRKNYNYVYVSRVELTNDNKLKIVTTNSKYTDEADMEEMHVYTVDLKAKKLTEDKVVVAYGDSKISQQEMMSVYLVEGDLVKDNKQLVFAKEIMEEVQQQEEFYYKPKIIELVAYDLNGDKVEQLDLPKEIQKEMQPTSVNESVIYFKKLSKNKVEIVGYDVKTKKIVSEQTFDLPESEDWGEHNIVTADGKIYFVNSIVTKQEEGIVYVGDLNTGKQLYLGTIESNGNSKLVKDFNIYIHGLEVKK